MIRGTRKENILRLAPGNDFTNRSATTTVQKWVHFEWSMGPIGPCRNICSDQVYILRFVTNLNLELGFRSLHPIPIRAILVKFEPNTKENKEDGDGGGMQDTANAHLFKS